jgi:hypothetical protein
MSRQTLRYASLLLSVAVLGALYIKMDPAKVFAEIASVDPVFLAFGLFCVHATVLVQALRGYLLLVPVKASTQAVVPFFPYARAYYSALCIASLTPARIGLLAQIPLLRRLGVTLGNSAVNTLLDKFYDLAAFCSLAAISSIALVFFPRAGSLSQREYCRGICFGLYFPGAQANRLMNG